MIEVIAHTPTDVLPQLPHPIQPGEECGLLRGGQGSHVFQRLLEHPHQRVVIACVIHATASQKVENFLTVEHCEFGQAIGLAQCFLVIADGFFGLANRNRVAKVRGIDPTDDHILIRFQRIIAKTKASVQECLVVLAGGVQVLHKPNQTSAVEVGQLGFVVAP